MDRRGSRGKLRKPATGLPDEVRDRALVEARVASREYPFSSGWTRPSGTIGKPMTGKSTHPVAPPDPVREPGSRTKARPRRILRHRVGATGGNLARIRQLERDRDQLALVLRLNNLLASQLEPERLFQAMSDALWQDIHHEFMGLSLLEADGRIERVIFLHTPAGRETPSEPILGPVSGMPTERALRTGQVDVLGPDRIGRVAPHVRQHLEKAGIRSLCCVPLLSRGATLGSLSFGSMDADHFNQEEVRLLGQIGVQWSIALDNALAFRNLQVLKDRLAEEKLFLQEEVESDFATREIIGRSPALMRVLEQVETVAPSNATVLLLGETGTGKELLARAIQKRSPRRDRPFVRLNCSAIPLGLIESELFGHERGAFTGAIQRKTGRFELAHQGTLFLDEVGDLPLELQPKLLRAIQEREFERLGGTVTQKVDVRLIAATHRSLPGMVQDGRFRQDLYYRLNVFPILVPPLRERKEDIPALVAFFTQKFARQLDRRIEHIPAASMERLVAWSWPGNIRELQNIIERSVILSQGAELKVPVADLDRPQGLEPPAPPRTLEELEREEIRKVLHDCGGVIGGPGGAAARLGVKRTTLTYRMKKLGVLREGRD
jgi:formate hydrogenlyase transcriptional activator